MAPPTVPTDTNTSLAPGTWQVSFAYRYFHSFRDFQGSQALPVPADP